MAAAPTRQDHEVRLKSSRAPYTRGGVNFASNRETVIIPGGEITDDQLRRLAEDATAITIEVVVTKSGKPGFLVLDDGAAIGDAELIAADLAAREKAAVAAKAKAAGSEGGDA